MSPVQHTPGPWRPGKNSDSVVADVPVEHGPGGSDAIEYYGGHLVAESVAPCNRPIIAAAPSMYDALHQIAYEPFGHDEATDREVLDAITALARQTVAAIAKHVEGAA